jgi:hypothetical protein
VAHNSSEVDGLPLAVRHPAVITVLAPLILTHDPVDAKPHPVVAGVNTRLPDVQEIIDPLVNVHHWAARKGF